MAPELHRLSVSWCDYMAGQNPYGLYNLESESIKMLEQAHDVHRRRQGASRVQLGTWRTTDNCRRLHGLNSDMTCSGQRVLWGYNWQARGSNGSNSAPPVQPQGSTLTFQHNAGVSWGTGLRHGVTMHPRGRHLREGMIPLSHGTYTRTASERQPQTQQLLLLLHYDQQRKNLWRHKEKDGKEGVQTSIEDLCLPRENCESSNNGFQVKSNASSAGEGLQSPHKGYNNEEEFKNLWNKDLERKQLGSRYGGTGNYRKSKRGAILNCITYHNATQQYNWIWYQGKLMHTTSSHVEHTMRCSALGGNTTTGSGSHPHICTTIVSYYPMNDNSESLANWIVYRGLLSNGPNFSRCLGAASEGGFRDIWVMYTYSRCNVLTEQAHTDVWVAS